MKTARRVVEHQRHVVEGRGDAIGELVRRVHAGADHSSVPRRVRAGLELVFVIADKGCRRMSGELVAAIAAPQALEGLEAEEARLLEELDDTIRQRRCAALEWGA